MKEHRIKLFSSKKTKQLKINKKGVMNYDWYLGN